MSYRSSHIQSVSQIQSQFSHDDELSNHRRFGYMDEPIRMDGEASSPNNPVGLFENATIEFEDVNLSRRISSDLEKKEAPEPSTLDQYQRNIEKKLELGEKAERDVKVVVPNDNVNF